MTVDCMPCLVAMGRGRQSHGTFQEPDGGITHATNEHPSYGTWRAVLCTFRLDGRLRLVPR